MKFEISFEFDDVTITTTHKSKFILRIETVTTSEPFSKRVKGSISNPPLALSLLADHKNLTFSFSFFNQSEGVMVETNIKHCHFTGEDSVEENKIFFESEDTEGLDLSIYS